MTLEDFRAYIQPLTDETEILLECPYCGDLLLDKLRYEIVDGVGRVVLRAYIERGDPRRERLLAEGKANRKALEECAASRPETGGEQ